MKMRWLNLDSAIVLYLKIGLAYTQLNFDNKSLKLHQNQSNDLGLIERSANKKRRDCLITMSKSY